MKPCTFKLSEEVLKLIDTAKHSHDFIANQKYADLYPYSFHLDLVYAQCRRFSYLLTESEFPICALGCYFHDFVEDVIGSYNQLKELAGFDVAEIAFLCTDYCRGRNRADKRPQQYYDELNENRLAVFVKVCDVLANTLFSFTSNSRMYEGYKKEYPKLRGQLYREEFKDMFYLLDKIHDYVLVVQ